MGLDQSRVKQIAEDALPHMLQALRLDHWTVGLLYQIQPEWGDLRGRIVYRPEYQRASIWLNAANLDDTLEVLTVLRHEVLHMKGTPVDSFADVVMPAVNIAGEAMLQAANIALVKEREQVVWQWEQALDSLGLSPLRLAGIPVTCSNCGCEHRVVVAVGVPETWCRCGQSLYVPREGNPMYPDADDGGTVLHGGALPNDGDAVDCTEAG